MSARLPTTFEPAIETVITYSITAIDNESATASIITATNRIEANPTTWSCFTLSG
jgi:hypothetical protein